MKQSKNIAKLVRCLLTFIKIKLIVPVEVAMLVGCNNSYHIEHCISNKLACTDYFPWVSYWYGLITFLISSENRTSLNFLATKQTCFQRKVFLLQWYKHNIFRMVCTELKIGHSLMTWIPDLSEIQIHCADNS